jgi:hypothetical protein
MWQGKAIVLSVGLPLILAYGLRFALSPNGRDGVMLGAAQVAAVGCTSSALWIAPVAALMALACALRPSRQAVKTLALGALGSVYVLVVGGLTRLSLRGIFDVSRGDAGARLQAALVTVLGDSWLLCFGLASLLSAWVLAPAGLGRRFAVVCPLVGLLGLWNPYAVHLVATNVTGPSYWRSAWALPLPILMTLVLTSPLHLGGGQSRPRARGALCLLLLVAFAVLVPRFGGLTPANHVELGWPRLKVPQGPYRWAAAVNASVAPGSPVAVPEVIEPWVVTFHHHAHPTLVRHYLNRHSDIVGSEDLAHRWAMRGFLNAPESVAGAPQRFRDGLRRFRLQAVCLARPDRAAPARTILEQAGFRKTLGGEDYELWVRARPPGI